MKAKGGPEAHCQALLQERGCRKRDLGLELRDSKHDADEKQMLGSWEAAVPTLPRDARDAPS